ncbi:MAG: metal ABC transporter substrate-binding protein [Clostridia bacterium]|nr:metal ABC transporter substrate-binding protein [Clostridia bacterium]
MKNRKATRFSLILLASVLVLSAALLAGCAGSNGKTIRVGASSTPHAEILEQVKADLAAKGYTLEIVTYDDYVLPNNDLQNGTLDANYFQHTPYLNSFNKSNNTTLVSAGAIHYEPFGLYGNAVSSLQNLPSGTKVFIPADDSNETRALLLLAQEGLIVLPEGANAADGVNHLDIVDAKGLDIQPVEASTVPAQFRNAGDGTLAVINGNYAIGAGIKIADALATENADGDAAQTYANIVAVKAGNESSEAVKALIEVLKTDKVRNFLKEKYAGAVVAAF